MKLIEALDELKRDLPAQSPVLAVDLVCGFTPLHFATFLRAHLRKQFPGHQVLMRTGAYGDLGGNVERLESQSAATFVVILEWQDLDPRLGIRRLGGWAPTQLSDILRDVRGQTERLAGALARITRGNSVTLSLPTLPVPPVAFTPGWQASAFESDLREAVASLASRLASLDGIRIVSSQRLERISSPTSRLDVRSELSTGFPYTLGHADALADLTARILRNPLPRKGLITDLDDTLWKGILGEVGVESIAWDLDHHAQKHGLYQQLLASLAEAGTLIGVASKNDPALVEEAFERAKPLLPRDRIFPLEVNWGPKSASTSRILKAWNISAESVVFVDDSPLDLSEVKQAHPEIESRLFPRDDDEAAYRLLEDLRDLFGKQFITAEDDIRLASIRASHSAAEVSVSHGVSSESFLQQAGGKLTVSFSRTPADPRGLELINKTNQFNLNGRRHTETSWREYFGNPDAFLLLASYEDKFGPLGKIAVMAGRQNGSRISIDHWVMSCRAFSRRIEHGLLLHLFRKFGSQSADFDFTVTPRNGPLRDFFAELMETAPDGPFTISRQQFDARRSQVYFEIQGSTSE
jgi:FkbH-like protein